MTQSDVVNHFAEKTGMKRADVKKAFDELSRLASREVESSGEFLLPGFGKLIKAEIKARKGRNPATGEAVQIPAQTKLKFRINKTLKDATLPGHSAKGFKLKSTAPWTPAPAPVAELAGKSTKENEP
jgi:DNA-binding protein HU-beta